MRLEAATVGVFAVVTVAALVFLWRGEERRVRSRVTAAAAALSGRPGEGDLDRLARFASLARALTPDIVVESEAGGPAIHGRDAVAGLASQLAAAGGPQTIELTDVTVQFNDTKSRAVVTAVLRVSSATPGPASTQGAVASRDGDVVRLELVKAGDDWLIAYAAPTPALAR